ncbi:hypothetical protein [Rariglobus hedericola]|uniref:FAD/FMN-containing dehydrogenase n=1 Tax=Rariglobus hedericola TaxID=2597822 RepID=A0A556QK97_9BACT|nr:hypothetical protein [Rariglobus hedericola]TSJ77032.1 hypothetical protein FPL22_13050 [Rariglobus hedericola]
MVLFSVLGLTAVRAVETYKTGDTLEAFTVTDAKGATFAYEPGKLAYLIVSYEMSPGKVVNGFLAKQPADFLDANRAAFMANIYGMPAIGRFFALPKMAKYPHRILLADSETLLARHPVKEDRVTVFSLDAKGVITGIRQLDPQKELGQLFSPTK